MYNTNLTKLIKNNLCYFQVFRVGYRVRDVVADHFYYTPELAQIIGNRVTVWDEVYGYADGN